jgi:hypothetical protein
MSIAIRAGRESNGGELRPGFVNIFSHVGFGVWSRVGRDDIEPAGQILGCPTRADDTRANDRDSANRFVVVHNIFSFVC